MAALIQTGKAAVEAFVSWGRWIAPCAFCPNAVRPTFGTPAFQCRMCDTVSEIVWPSEEMARGIYRLLMMRPNYTNRNWLPGETLNDLMWENGENGIFDHLEARGVEATPGTDLFVVEGDHIRIDALPALTPVRPRRMVGA